MIVAWHEVPGKRPSKEPSRRVRYDRAQLIPEVFFRRRCAPRFFGRTNYFSSIIESVRTPARIMPYHTGRLFWGGAAPGTSCQATIAPSLRDEKPVIPKQNRERRTTTTTKDD
jgi:hypothetical protein